MFPSDFGLAVAEYLSVKRSGPLEFPQGVERADTNQG
jgi:hypothetical protein